jgi:hypothetical protein
LRRVLPSDVDGALPGMWVGAVPHPAVLLAFLDGPDLERDGDCPPLIVRNAARLSFTTSIAIFHSGTGRILEVANSSRVSILGSEAVIGICPRSNILNVQFCSD